MAADGEVVEDRGLILDGWQRSGGCHDGCGRCCEYMVLPLDPRVRNDPAYKDWWWWVGLHNIRIMGNKAHIPLPCVHLTKDKKCAVYGTDARPHMCDEGPRLPSEIVGLEEVCTYEWSRTEK